MGMCRYHGTGSSNIGLRQIAADECKTECSAACIGDSASRTVTTQESTLEELVEAAFQSSHTRSHFLLDEEVLANAPELAEQLALPKYVCVALLFVCVCLCL